MLYGFKLENIDQEVVDRELAVAAARQSLAEQATVDNKQVRSLHDQVQHIAKLEAELLIFQGIQRMIQIGKATPDQMYRHLVETHALMGADDGWSGRTNDLRRATFDAKLELIRDLRYVLKTED